MSEVIIGGGAVPPNLDHIRSPAQHAPVARSGAGRRGVFHMDRTKVLRGAAVAVAAITSAYVSLGALTAAGAQPSPSPSPSATEPSPAPSGSPGEASPQPSESPAGPVVRLLNPNPALAPGGDPPIVSDRPDGHGESFHLVAFVPDLPQYPIVEASFRSWSHPLPPGTPPEPVPNPVATSVGGEGEIALMSPVAGAPNVFELDWDVPDELPNGNGTVTVRLYTATEEGPVELASHAVDVSLRHSTRDANGNDATPAPAAELSWPHGASGHLGFYRSKTTGLTGTSSNVWASAIDGTASAAGSVELRYTVDPLDGPLEFTSCEFASAGATGEFGGMCDLAGLDLPSQVTAVAAVPASGAADVHVVAPYLQNVEKMDLALAPSPTARALPHGCVGFVATVEDERGRLVPNVNVDIEVRGPNDDTAFGVGQGLPILSAPQPAPPDSGAHPTQSQAQCNSEQRAAQQQGYHRMPRRPDVKHVEFATGTSGDGLGRLAFNVYSSTEGTADVVAWIDDRPLRSDSVSRLEDDDLIEEGEPSARGRAYWYPEAAEILLDQEADAAAPGECLPVTLRVRADATPVAGINVDVHLSTEDGAAGFCDPESADARRHPDEGAHAGDVHRDAERPTRHAEGETDSLGNFAFGVTSSSPGTSEVVAWIDGEPEREGGASDDDVLAAGESSIEARQTWGSAREHAHVSLLNPSPVGGGDPPVVSGARDADTAYRLVARVDAPQLVPEVEFQVAAAGSADFGTIGTAPRLGASDAYALQWDTSGMVPGNYVVRAAIPGTDRRDEAPVSVDNGKQSVALSAPALGSRAAFDERAVVVEGVASAAAAGIDLYYVTRGRAAGDTPGWERCGGVDFSAAGTERSFSVQCALAGNDRPYRVVALAAVALFEECSVTSCERVPHAADVARVYGVVAQPGVSLEPYRHEAQTGDCRRMVMEVADERGELLASIDVDVELAGSRSTFCDPGGAAPQESSGAGDGPLRLEGRTSSAGTFEFGVVSTQPGDSDVVAWVDEVEDDVRGADEPFDSAVVHWVADTSCTQVGTRGRDTLVGGPGRDKLCGRGGDDVLRGRGGDDVLVGGGGRDSLRGGGGRDLLYGNAARDRLDGGAGDDVCLGGGGRDRLRRCEEGDVRRGKPFV